MNAILCIWDWVECSECMCVGLGYTSMMWPAILELQTSPSHVYSRVAPIEFLIKNALNSSQLDSWLKIWASIHNICSCTHRRAVCIHGFSSSFSHCISHGWWSKQFHKEIDISYGSKIHKVRTAPVLDSFRRRLDKFQGTKVCQHTFAMMGPWGWERKYILNTSCWCWREALEMATACLSC